MKQILAAVTVITVGLVLVRSTGQTNAAVAGIVALFLCIIIAIAANMLMYVLLGSLGSVVTRGTKDTAEPESKDSSEGPTRSIR